jgi:hypothetical protein
MYKGQLWLVALFNTKFHEHAQILWIVSDIHTIHSSLQNHERKLITEYQVLGQAFEAY